LNVNAHYESLTRELEALKDRVRNFGNRPKWLTDGEWKESVLRSMLRRYIPAGIEPLRGYVVTAESSSRQLDVLLYDNRRPVLFRDGDLVFVTPDAARGIIEVKTKIDGRQNLMQALKPLAENAALIRSDDPYASFDATFAGLFSYETSAIDPADVLDVLDILAQHRMQRIITHLCLGCSLFVRYWVLDPHTGSTSINSWYAYRAENRAAGYFIASIVEAVAEVSVSQNRDIWYPADDTHGLQKVAERRFSGA